MEKEKNKQIEKLINHLKNMITFLKSLKVIFAPLKTIQNDPGKFILWLTTSVILSLASFWVPILLGKIVNRDLYQAVMDTNPFVIYSIVFLCNSVLLSINYIGAGKNKSSINLRGIALVCTIMYLILLASIISVRFLTDETINHRTQYLLLSIAIILGVYVYGFRESDWEDGLAGRNKKQKEDIDRITNSAEIIDKDPNGVKL